MKSVSLLICSTVLAAGVLGGATAYQLAAEPSAGTPAAVTTSPSATHAGAVRDRVRTRFAPCPAGSRPDGKVCVVHVVKTVTRPAPVGLTPPAPIAAPAPPTAAVPTASGWSEDDEDEGDDHGDDHGDDDGDDHGGEDDDHEDDD